MLAAIVYGVIRVWRLWKWDSGELTYDQEITRIIVTVAAAFVAVIGGIIFVCMAHESGCKSLLAWFSPRLYVLQYVSELVK